MARGMNPAKVEQWAACLARFQDTGLTVARFCEEEGVSAASFYHWRRELARETKTGGSVRRVGKPRQEKKPAGVSRRLATGLRSGSAFQAVEVVTAAAATIRFPNGVEIELGSDLRAFELLLGQLLNGAASGEDDRRC
jgi:transposase-like protein